jgi:hypothetical protein
MLGKGNHIPILVIKMIQQEGGHAYLKLENRAMKDVGDICGCNVHHYVYMHWQWLFSFIWPPIYMYMQIS